MDDADNCRWIDTELTSWRSTVYKKRTAVNSYKSHLHLVLLSGFETYAKWGTHLMESECRLGTIADIETGINNTNDEIRKTTWRWFLHLFRMK